MVKDRSVNSVDEWPLGVSNPARRALAHAGYTDLEQLAALTEKDLLALHGVGPKAVRLLRAELERRGLGLGLAAG